MKQRSHVFSALALATVVGLSAVAPAAALSPPPIIVCDSGAKLPRCLPPFDKDDHVSHRQGPGHKHSRGKARNHRGDRGHGHRVSHSRG